MCLVVDNGNESSSNSKSQVCKLPCNLLVLPTRAVWCLPMQSARCISAQQQADQIHEPGKTVALLKVEHAQHEPAGISSAARQRPLVMHVALHCCSVCNVQGCAKHLASQIQCTGAVLSSYYSARVLTAHINDLSKPEGIWKPLFYAATATLGHGDQNAVISTKNVPNQLYTIVFTTPA